ncbi:MAG: hypothetical protein V1782_12395 [Pseudomonadota bacterium]
MSEPIDIKISLYIASKKLSRFSEYSTVPGSGRIDFESPLQPMMLSLAGRKL